MMQQANPPLKLAASKSIGIIIFFFVITSCSPVCCLYFNYTNFPDNSTNDFIRTNAYITANTIQITPDFLTNQSGRIFHNHRFRLYNSGGGRRASFDTKFTLQINPKTRPSGEGLAFILTGNTALPVNSSGQWLGIANSIASRFSTKIVAVEFDTRKSYPDDLDDNHAGLDINDVYSIRQESLSAFRINLSSSDVVTARIRYDGYTLMVFVSLPDMRQERLVISHQIDLSDHLPEVVHVGFSGSTSQFVQQNCILSWEFSGSDISSSERGWWVWVVISVSVMGLIVGGAGFIYRGRKLAREMRKVEDEDDDCEDAHPSVEEAIRGSSTAPKKFKLDELRDATDYFDSKNMLGRGGFGTVYKGILGNGEVVAVKKVSEGTSQGKQEFVAEVTTIGNLRHKNLVKLIGWARERCEYLLVYEYMPNGSLDKFIFAPRSSSPIILSWGTRLRIITGIAQAVEYLHNGCDRKVLHRDIKASNVMIDSNFDARLGDFGLARTIAQADQTHHSTKALAGTPGYMAPELFLTGRSTPETDVYGFGILVLEIVCGKKPAGGGPGGQLDRDDNYASNIVKWVWELYGAGRLIDAADRRMMRDFEDEKLQNVLTLGLSCCHPDPYGRPSMKTVLQVLTGEVAAVPEVPLDRPAFTWPSVAPCFEDRRSMTGSQSFTEITGR